MGALIDTLKFIALLSICGALLVAFFWGLTILIPPGEDTHAGQDRVEWDEAIYTCSECVWSGYPGAMNTIQKPLNNFGKFYNMYYCPECGAPMEQVRDSGLVYVDSNNYFMGKATLGG